MRNVQNTAIRRARSPWLPFGSVTADVHGCLRGVAPIKPPLTLRDNSVAHMGGEMIKRCRIVQDRIRLWKQGVRDLVMELCCALHNFLVRLTPWQPVI